MSWMGGRYRHHGDVQLTYCWVTCHTAPGADYSFDIYYDQDGSGAGTVIETVTIPAGEKYGAIALDGQRMTARESEVWVVAQDDLPPDGFLLGVEGEAVPRQRQRMRADRGMIGGERIHLARTSIQALQTATKPISAPQPRASATSATARAARGERRPRITRPRGSMTGRAPAHTRGSRRGRPA